MKNTQDCLHKLTVAGCLAFGMGATLLAPALARADSANGNLIIQFDQTTLMKMNGGSTEIGQRWWWVEDFFDQSHNYVVIDGAEPNPTPGYDALPDPIIEMKFAVNPPDIKPATDEVSRLLQPTTFKYSDTPEQGSGLIGVSGAFRMRSDSRKGYLLPKEMTLGFYPERVGKGGVGLYDEVAGAGHGESGWAIKTNEDYFGTQGLFDLTNVTTSTVNGALKLSGDLIWAAEWGSFLLLDMGVKVGTVSLEPTGDAPVDGTGAIKPPVPGATTSGSYDDATQEASIVDVQVQNQHYFVQLKLQANGLFGLKSADLIKATAINAMTAQYDVSSQLLTIPIIKALGKKFNVILKNTGDYQFSMVDAVEVK